MLPYQGRFRSTCTSKYEEALDMPNDAKLGLIVGVGVVIAVAVVFFHKEPGAPGPNESPPAAVGDPTRPVKARPTSFSKEEVPAPEVRRHTVKEGDTLFSLAQEYYGAKDSFLDIYQANRTVLSSPDQLTPGTLLVIPERAEAAAP
jgi:phage tail protein X